MYRKVLGGILFSLVLLVASTTSAQSTESIQAQIAALMAQMQQQGGTPDASPDVRQCVNFSRTLSYAKRGNDITALQSFLIQQGDLEAGNNTGFFGRLTESAVRKFQCREMGICSGSAASNGYGQVGPATRRAILSSCSTPSFSTTPPNNSGMGDTIPNTDSSETVTSPSEDYTPDASNGDDGVEYNAVVDIPAATSGLDKMFSELDKLFKMAIPPLDEEEDTE